MNRQDETRTKVRHILVPRRLTLEETWIMWLKSAGYQLRGAQREQVLRAHGVATQGNL